ncbi:MAG: hypothetical protein ABL982_22590 [Vicinamibacterales bacterium]
MLIPARSALNGIESKTSELPGVLRALADAVMRLASRADVSADDVERAVSLGRGLASAVSACQ